MKVTHIESAAAHEPRTSSTAIVSTNSMGSSSELRAIASRADFVDAIR
jgi:hypothetical protein